MSETEKLAALRHKLISKRRSLVESLQKVPDQQLTGDSLARIQAGIDAVDRAIEDETHSESAIQATRRPSTISGEK
jgi:hypothetical protein